MVEENTSYREVEESLKGKRQDWEKQYGYTGDGDDDILEERVPRSDPGGGVDGKNGGLGPLPKSVKKVWDPENSVYVFKEELRYPGDRVEAENTSSQTDSGNPGEKSYGDILTRFPEESHSVVKTFLSQGWSEEEIARWIKLPEENKSEQPADSGETVSSQNKEASDSPSEEYVPPVFDSEGPMSENGGLSTGQVNIPNPMGENGSSGNPDYNSFKRVTVTNAAGTFKTRYADVLESKSVVLALYDRDQDIFIPRTAGSEDDYFTLEADNSEYKLLFAGDDIEVPGLRYNILVFYKKE